jgi:hypothetical protein
MVGLMKLSPARPFTAETLMYASNGGAALIGAISHPHR